VADSNAIYAAPDRLVTVEVLLRASFFDATRCRCSLHTVR